MGAGDVWTQLVALGISMLALGVAVVALLVGGRDVSDFERGRIEGRREVIAEMNGLRKNPASPVGRRGAMGSV